MTATRDQRPLRFTADGDQATERAWRTHWMRADLPEATRERLTRRQSKPPDLVVIEPLDEWRCTACGGSGRVFVHGGPGSLCMDCADLGHLVFLPAGNAAMWWSRRGWPRRWRGCSPAARRGASRPSPDMPRSGAAAGLAGRQPGASGTSRRSRWP